MMTPASYALTRRRLTWTCVCLLCALALAYAAVAARSSATPAAAPNGRIVFVSGRDGDLEIYTVHADGSGLRRLTDNAADDTDPRWSYDGSRIAFSSARDGSREIYSMDADGLHQTRLTFRESAADASSNADPTWSPDGTKIAFVRTPNAPGTTAGIYVMNADGSGQQRLTDHQSVNDQPAWSPDGKKIAFRSSRAAAGATSSIYVMNPDGSEQTQFTTTQFSVAENPSWFADGRDFVFNGVTGFFGNALYRMTAEGFFRGGVLHTNGGAVSRPAWAPNNDFVVYERREGDDTELYIRDLLRTPEKLASSPHFDGSPDWQRFVPGAGKLSFISRRDGNDELYTMRGSDGGDQRRLTSDAQAQTAHAWSPDGTKLAFVRERDDNLYVINADGTGLTRLTDDDFQHTAGTSLSWSPDGSKIAYVAGSDLVHNLYSINADGTNKRLLHPLNNPYLDLAWSPDGTRLAFSVGHSFNHSDLYVMNADGGGETVFTSAPSGVYHRSLAWSPDGYRIAFESNRDGNDEIYVLYLSNILFNPVVQNVVRLTNDPARDIDPVWSPDGSRIAFATDRDGNSEIYTMESDDGAGPQRLTSNAAHDAEPEWQPAGRPAPPPSVPLVQFAAPSFRTFENGTSEAGAGPARIVVTRLGDVSRPATVTYETSDGTASQRSDYTPVFGRLDFAPGETAKSFTVPVNYDSFIEGDETVNLTITGAPSFGSQRTARLVISDFYIGAPPRNAIDATDNFVRQHYHDFLNREPDAEGLAFWIQNIESCGADQQCREARRVGTSGAFFHSIEFQETGFFLHRLQVLTFGTRPRYADYLRDVQKLGDGVVVKQGDWRERLQQNKEAFFGEWVGRQIYRNVCGGKPNGAFVDLLLSHVSFTPPPGYRDALVAALDARQKTQNGVLLEIAESQAFKDSEKNRAFVLMQYFGYLRRNPDDPPDSDLTGYNFWLTKLDSFGGDYRRAEMVKAFLSSTEYRQRFGTP